MLTTPLIDSVKRLLRGSPAAYNWSRSLYSRVYPRLKRGYEQALRRQILQQVSHLPRVCVVQVGANDGISGDFTHELLARESWHGVLVEPMPQLFAKLAENYRHTPRYVLENVAISLEPGRRTFYYADRSVARDSGATPAWWDQIASLSREHVLRQVRGMEQVIREQAVECISFDDLCRRNSLDRIDFVHIDTEGYDYQVLRQIDFPHLKPLAVMYEHRHLSDCDRRSAFDLLRSHGYCHRSYGPDSLALLKNGRRA